MGHEVAVLSVHVICMGGREGGKVWVYGVEIECIVLQVHAICMGGGEGRCGCSGVLCVAGTCYLYWRRGGKVCM